MRFTATAHFATATALETALPTLQRGQWISLDGTRGRVVGQGNTAWIAWGETACNPWRFRKMVAGYKRTLTPLEIIRRDELAAFRAF
jgi:hypothetical protein